jgi:hypothetical protein
MNKSKCPSIEAHSSNTHPRWQTRDLTLLLIAAAMAFLTGCHSAYVTATVSNHGSSSVSVVQVEYPSASFGTQTIAPGHDFKYRFKVLGSGSMKITYTDSTQAEHKFVGPQLKEGDEGSLSVVIEADKVDWQPRLTAR